jgi:hypothetical protein
MPPKPSHILSAARGPGSTPQLGAAHAAVARGPVGQRGLSLFRRAVIAGRVALHAEWPFGSANYTSVALTDAQTI